MFLFPKSSEPHFRFYTVARPDWQPIQEITDYHGNDTADDSGIDDDAVGGDDDEDDDGGD